MMTQRKCPICRREIEGAPEDPSFPFCGPRCKWIDLGRWLDGVYRIPGPPAAQAAGEGSAGDPGELPS